MNSISGRLTGLLIIFCFQFSCFAASDAGLENVNSCSYYLADPGIKSDNREKSADKVIKSRSSDESEIAMKALMIFDKNRNHCLNLKRSVEWFLLGVETFIVLDRDKQIIKEDFITHEITVFLSDLQDELAIISTDTVYLNNGERVATPAVYDERTQDTVATKFLGDLSRNRNVGKEYFSSSRGQAVSESFKATFRLCFKVARLYQENSEKMGTTLEAIFASRLVEAPDTDTLFSKHQNALNKTLEYIQITIGQAP